MKLGRTPAPLRQASFLSDQILRRADNYDGAVVTKVAKLEEVIADWLPKASEDFPAGSASWTESISTYALRDSSSETSGSGDAPWVGLRRQNPDQTTLTDFSAISMFRELDRGRLPYGTVADLDAEALADLGQVAALASDLANRSGRSIERELNGLAWKLDRLAGYRSNTDWNDLGIRGMGTGWRPSLAIRRIVDTYAAYDRLPAGLPYALAPDLSPRVMDGRVALLDAAAGAAVAPERFAEAASAVRQAADAAKSIETSADSLTTRINDIIEIDGGGRLATADDGLAGRIAEVEDSLTFANGQQSAPFAKVERALVAVLDELSSVAPADTVRAIRREMGNLSWKAYSESRQRLNFEGIQKRLSQARLAVAFPDLIIDPAAGTEQVVAAARSQIGKALSAGRATTDDEIAANIDQLTDAMRSIGDLQNSSFNGGIAGGSATELVTKEQLSAMADDFRQAMDSTVPWWRLNQLDNDARNIRNDIVNYNLNGRNGLVPQDVMKDLARLRGVAEQQQFRLSELDRPVKVAHLEFVSKKLEGMAQATDDAMTNLMNNKLPQAGQSLSKANEWARYIAQIGRGVMPDSMLDQLDESARKFSDLVDRARSGSTVDATELGTAIGELEGRAYAIAEGARVRAGMATGDIDAMPRPTGSKTPPPSRPSKPVAPPSAKPPADAPKTPAPATPPTAPSQAQDGALLLDDLWDAVPVEVV